MNFIVVDDNKEFLKTIANLISKIMVNNKIDYKILSFNEYNNEFYETFNISDIKIYILDIEVGNTSGIDIARKIRNHSTEDYIIFISAYEKKYKNPIFNNTIRYYAFINKNNINKLDSRIKSILSEVDNKGILSYYYKGHYYKIKTNMILYIQTDKNKKTIIKTDDLYDRECPLKLGELYQILGDKFIKTNRFYLVNKERTLIYSFKEKYILFDNNTFLQNCISRSLKREDFEKLINT